MGERRKVAANSVPSHPSTFLDHYFGRFDDYGGPHRLSLQSKFFGAGTLSDDAFDQIVADFNDDMRHDGAELNSLDHAWELISC